VPRRGAPIGRLLVGILGLPALSACATMHPPAGHDFTQAAFARFVLNETSLGDVEAALGPPMKQSTVKGLAKPTATLVAPGTPLSLVTLQYYWAPNGFGLPANAHPAKTASVTFLNGRLVAYGFTTAIPGEVQPPIEEAMLTGLHQGATTRDEAVAMLGTPNGAMVHVLDKQKGESEINYGWRRVSNGTVEQRSLELFFDKYGRLTTYRLLDNDFPANSAPIQLPMPVPPPAQPVPHPMIPQPDLNHT
jgi:hypothetical protein